ncbi:arginine--tRNA ligase [Firmicutes bacterium CAG:552]|nr:arginine--tRNA ligase [Firmicutes bacterium CAG:552]
MDFLKDIEDYLIWAGAPEENVRGEVVWSQDPKNGDCAFPCFKLSKSMRKSPMIIASELSSKGNLPLFVARTECVSGYLNFFFDRELVAKEVLLCCKERGETYEAKRSKGKTICIDYSSVNIAKPFHIGHLLTTVIGGSLYRIYKYLGYNVVGINHLGDWGTQFGKLIVAYLKWGKGEQTMDSLLDLYVKFHREAETNDSLNDEARMWFKKIEDGDKQATELFAEFKRITLEEVDKVYKRLGITFDSYNGEAFYNDKMQPIIDALKQKNLLVESDGAMVVNLDEYGMPPCLILKSDGATLYATRDLAAAVYRKNTYDFYKNLYVVAYQQNLHFKQLFKVLELLGYDWAKDCVHVPFGMVSLEGVGAMSTREGKVVKLKDVLSEAVDKAKAIISQKNPELENKDETAEAIGVGAVVFGALINGRIKDVVFSVDKALNFDGETGPYLQYTHARCCSILSKGEAGEVDYSTLTDDETFELVRLLSRFDQTVTTAAERYEPSIISRYLIDLAQAFNKFYIGHRVICDDEKLQSSRLAITKAVRDALRNGMSLILLKAPEKM